MVSRGWHHIYHSVWKSLKKSHSTLRAKRATFTFWVDKSSLKMCHFGKFLKTWSLQSSSVTRQVNFDRTKIGAKIEKLNVLMSLWNHRFWLRILKSVKVSWSFTIIITCIEVRCNVISDLAHSVHVARFARAPNSMIRQKKFPISQRFLFHS